MQFHLPHNGQGFSKCGRREVHCTSWLLSVGKGRDMQKLVPKRCKCKYMSRQKNNNKVFQ